MMIYKNIIFVFLFSFILIFPATVFSQTNQNDIPDWVRNTAYWWSQGDISDSEYKNAMKFLIENGIISISSQNQNIVDMGDFYTTYDEPNDPYYDEIMFWAMDNEELMVNLSGINAIKLPHDVEIKFMQCNEANAFYSSEERQIQLCYEFIDMMRNIQSEYYDSEEEIRHAVQDSIYETILHELGHGLVDMYNIPITGKEEDAVDQLSTIILLQEGQQGIDALYAVANWYDYFGQQITGIEQLPFHDEHSFEMQRFYSILCFVYGSDPERNYELIDFVPLETEQEIQRWSWLCVEEHEKISNSWNTFLDPLWN
ncbi:MAG: hypothetical protein HQ505_01930 [Nitrosopumilus sp.]|nr:hypothetical protein [Nitrosopumilus sp.]